MNDNVITPLPEPDPNAIGIIGMRLRHESVRFLFYPLPKERGCSKPVLSCAEERPPARPQELWRAERTAVREHDKVLRTPLVAFLVSP